MITLHSGLKNCVTKEGRFEDQALRYFEEQEIILVGYVSCALPPASRHRCTAATMKTTLQMIGQDHCHSSKLRQRQKSEHIVLHSKAVLIILTSASAFLKAVPLCKLISRLV